MISKEQFLELKHLKSLGVPTTTICKNRNLGAQCEQMVADE